MKKVIALFLVLALTLSLCACGMNPLKTIEIPTTQATDPATATETATEAATEAPTVKATKAPTTKATVAPTTKATEAPSTAATVAPTTEATVAPTTAPAELVKTVLEATYPFGDSGTTHQHELKWPKLTADTLGAQAINDEIHEAYSKALADIEDGEPGSMLYQYDYCYEINNGIVALLVNYLVGFVPGEYFPYCKAYYYDSNTGKQLTHDEYLSAMEVTELQLLSAFNASNEEDEYSAPRDYKITGAAIGKEDTQLIVYYQTEMSDMFYITTVKTSAIK